MSEKILCVDDDINILRAFRRLLQKEYMFEIANSGQAGLATLANEGPFAVVVSDLKMPEMDGIQFLATVREKSPDSVRVMLTGQADLNTAIAAINEGNIFRFLTKPCSPEALGKILQAALEQYRLITAERTLLRQTLVGSVQVVTNTLSLVNPVAFSQGSRLKPLVRHIATQLSLPQIWRFELAAMLSQIGCMTLPPTLLQKVYAGRSLSSEEQELFSTHPQVAKDLLINIPRLELVAQMIAGQLRPSPERIWADDQEAADAVYMGAHMLKVVIAFDRLTSQGMSPRAAVAGLRKRPDEYLPEIVDALPGIEQGKAAA
jgi:response regulator RpfG family c-di-GMP phosphodiesterase